jgi:hypothetical protein
MAIIISCSGKKETSLNPLDFIASTTTIPIDKQTEPYSRTMQFMDGKLYWWNSDRESISIIDLGSRSLEKTIPLERDGPNGVGRPLGFFVHCPDSIYIPSMAYQISLIDSGGKLLNTFSYFNYSLLGILSGSMTRYSRMFLETNGKLVFQIESLQYLKREELNLESLDQYPPLIALNMQKGEFEIPHYRFPHSVLDLHNFINFSQTISPEGILLLHGQSNLLYQVNPDTFTSREFILQSNVLNNFSNEYYLFDRMSAPAQDNMGKLYGTAQNLGIAHDPFKNIVYRFGWPGEEIPEDVDPMKYSDTTPFFVIGIYDGEDLRLLEEFTLPRNTYLAHHYFVDENGLNLFPMHPDNPEFDENEMVIHTFDFGKLRK